MIIEIIIFIIIITIIIFIIKHKEILSFFYPDQWLLITILELDNTVTTKLIKKTKDLKFKFKDGNYYTFHPYSKKSDNSEVPEFIQGSGIYKNGRLLQFFYTEGNKYPIDFRGIEKTFDSVIDEKLNRISLTDWLTVSDDDILSLIKKNIVTIIIGIIILIVLFNK